MNSKRLLLLFIVIFYVNNLYSYDLKIMATDRHAYETIGTYNSTLLFQNLGTTNIQYFQVKWSLNNVLVDSVDVNVLNTWSSTLLPSDASGSYYFPLIINQSLPLSSEGDFIFEMWIDKVHGSPDANHSNDTISYVIHVANYLPTKRVLLEKYSHTTCGPCYEGDLSTIELLNNYDGLSVVTIHNAPDDPMSFPDGDLLDNYFSTAHPNFVFDRYLYAPNSVYGSSVWGGTSFDLDRRKVMKEGAEVVITHQTFNPSTRELNLTLQARFYANYFDTLAFNAWITEDSVFAYQANAPDPNNYYHMHVARAILGGVYGDIVNGATSTGSIIDYTFTYVLPPTFDENQIYVTGFIQRNNGNSIDVVNSTEQQLIEEEFVNTAELHNQDLKIFPNPTSNKVYVECKESIISITLSNLLGNVIYVNEQDNIDLSQLPNGCYILTVLTSKGEIRQLIEKM